MEVDLFILLSVVSFLMSAASFYYARRNDATELENRITKIETKIDPLWQAVVNEIPKLLIAPHSPILDGYLARGSELGWKCLKEIEFSHFEELLDQEMVALSMVLKAGVESSDELGKIRARITGLALVKAGAGISRNLKSEKDKDS